jgi:hypothetical protein
VKLRTLLLACRVVVRNISVVNEKGPPSPRLRAGWHKDAISAWLHHPSASASPEPAIPSDGSVFGISDLKAAETPDPNAEKNLTLRIGIKKLSDATIDPNEVRILVKFFDTVDDKEVLQTYVRGFNAQTFPPSLNSLRELGWLCEW